MAEALRHRKDQEAQEQHERDMDRAQVLGAHDRVRGVEVKYRHHDRDQRDERRDPAGQLVLHALLALDHLLGARERLLAHLRGRLMQAGDFFAHRSMKKPRQHAGRGLVALPLPQFSFTPRSA